MKFQELDANFDNIISVSLLYDTIATHPENVTSLVKDFYLNPIKNGGKWYLRGYMLIKPLIKMFGDFWFINGLLDAVEKHSGPKYLYHFNYSTSVSVCNSMYQSKWYEGACHLDELMYLFPMDVMVDNFINPSSRDFNQSLTMVELWTNFVKNAAPSALNVTWDPIKSSQMEHLEITKSGFVMKTDPIGDRRTFWKSLNLRKD